jgi:RimJ/RimL family protein N-acetyltransferase
MSDLKLGPAYRIETPRTVIRCWEPTDAPLLLAAVTESLEHLRPWMPWAMQEPTNLAEKVQLLRSFRAKFDLGEEFIYAVFNPDETQVLGGTGLHARMEGNAFEIGYWIHTDYINKGLATEITAALTKIAFEVDARDWVEIRHDPANAASGAVPKKLGYTQEAVLRGRLIDSQGQPRDTAIWSLFKEQYSDSPAAQAKIKAFDVVGEPLI